MPPLKICHQVSTTKEVVLRWSYDNVMCLEIVTYPDFALIFLTAACLMKKQQIPIVSGLTRLGKKLIFNRARKSLHRGDRQQCSSL